MHDSSNDRGERLVPSPFSLIRMLPDEPILIVDDDEGVCRLLTALKREGFRPSGTRPVRARSTGYGNIVRH